MSRRSIQQGIYLVIDPSMERSTLLNKLQQVVKEKIAAVQIWDNFKQGGDPKTLINEVLSLCHPANIPVLINNRWEWLRETDLDGVHFDSMPDRLPQLKIQLERNFITGVTCNNDLSVVRQADENKLDYVSFCSMFPSSTSNSCDLVTFETVKEARSISSLPVFLAGGIRPENIELLGELEYSGIAVVSGIMSAAEPRETIRLYEQKLNHHVK
jgi:thiamine-phosphate pyrophosphorylase